MLGDTRVVTDEKQDFAGLPRPTWDSWSEPIDSASFLTEAGRSVAKQAVQALRRFVGADWLERSLARGSVLFRMDLFLGNAIPSVYLHLIDIYAHIELLKSAPGMSRLRKGLQDNPQDINWRHALLQLEVAGLAIRDGWQVEFEPRHRTKGAADLLITSGARRMLVEMVVMGTDMKHRLAGEAFEALTQVGMPQDVSLSGDAGDIAFDDADLQRSSHRWTTDWLARLRDAIPLVTADGLSRLVIGPTGGRILVSKGYGLPGSTLRGPGGGGDILPRIQARISDKARAVGEFDGVWIRLDDVGALWYLTAWSRMSLMNKLTSIEPWLTALLQPYPNLAGVIMSNAWSWQASGIVDETVRSADGSVAMRRALRLQHYRETLIKVRQGRFAPDLVLLAEWYGRESSWISWALDQLNLPSLDELIIQP